MTQVELCYKLIDRLTALFFFFYFCSFLLSKAKPTENRVICMTATQRECGTGISRWVFPVPRALWDLIRLTELRTFNAESGTEQQVVKAERLVNWPTGLQFCISGGTNFHAKAVNHSKILKRER